MFGNMFPAVAPAVIFIYLILASQFCSFTHPLSIMLSLPLSLVGVALALLVIRDTLNIMSMIGVMVLLPEPPRAVGGSARGIACR